MGFSVPYLIACFLQLLYSMTDLYFVGKYCDVPSITAVTIGGQVLHMLTVMIVGITMGCTIGVAKATGAQHHHEASLFIGNTTTLFMLMSIPLTLILYICAPAITQIMATPTEATFQTNAYLQISFIGLPAIVAYNILASIFRGIGNTKTPMHVVAMACLCNVALNYLFVAYLQMGPAGAAWATIISQTAGVAMAIALFTKQNKGKASIQKSDFALRRHITRSILSIGTPIALQDGFIQISFILITIIANCRGLIDAAAVSICERVIGFLFLVPSALLSTVSAVSAQNFGANLHHRARLTLRYAIIIAITFGTLSSILFQFISAHVIGIFTTSQSVIISGEQYLMAYVWDCVFAGIHFCYSGYFCAAGKSIYSFIHNSISIILARIPLAYCASITFPATLYPMGLATVAGSLLSVIICHHLAKKLKTTPTTR